MTKPILLDLFCRKGGATVGYQRAGFHVIGVDVEPQPGYPGDVFDQGDALDFLCSLMAETVWPRFRPALIHASPPCQDGNTATASNRARGIRDTHVQLVEPVRDLLEKIGIPYVIEQPTSSRKDLIRRDVTLCMDMFKGSMPPPWVQKHRSFELGGWAVDQPEHPVGPVRGGSMVGLPKPAGHAGRIRGHRHGQVFEGPYVAGYGNGGGKGTPEELAYAMDAHWMLLGMGAGDRRARQFDLQEAIPPSYTQWLGTRFLEASLIP